MAQCGQLVFFGFDEGQAERAGVETLHLQRGLYRSGRGRVRREDGFDDGQSLRGRNGDWGNGGIAIGLRDGNHRKPKTTKGRERQVAICQVSKTRTGKQDERNVGGGRPNGGVTCCCLLSHACLVHEPDPRRLGGRGETG